MIAFGTVREQLEADRLRMERSILSMLEGKTLSVYLQVYNVSDYGEVTWIIYTPEVNEPYGPWKDQGCWSHGSLNAADDVVELVDSLINGIVDIYEMRKV